jgi:predicted RNA binding protein YcfA (HicA-like mRNA interferase family)
MNGKVILLKLKEKGFSILRVSGSHYILGNGKIKVSVPVHGSTDLKLGTLKAIEKQSGVKLR